MLKETLKGRPEEVQEAAVVLASAAEESLSLRILRFSITQRGAAAVGSEGPLGLVIRVSMLPPEPWMDHFREFDRFCFSTTI